MKNKSYNRKSNRLSTWDYTSPGEYFVTICSKNMKPIFGTITECGEEHFRSYHLTPSKIGEEAIDVVSSFRKDGCRIVKFVVMPNHMHLLIEILDSCNRPSLNSMVGAIKRAISFNCREQKPSDGIWQRSYHDHIVRNEEDRARIFDYIENNPQKWCLDRYYVDQ